ncbi:MAG: hypothetical protein QW493_04250, partial [Candidatus Bathyarchaeia archaeon]
EDFAIFFGGFCDFLSELEAAISKMKQKIAPLVGVDEEKWRAVQCVKPVPENERAIQWLKKRLEAIKGKHPCLKYRFVKNSDGLITELEYVADNDKTGREVERVCRWAFEKALPNPNWTKRH